MVIRNRCGASSPIGRAAGSTLALQYSSGDNGLSDGLHVDARLLGRAPDKGTPLLVRYGFECAPRMLLGGKLIARTEERDTHVEWLRFLKQIDRETPMELDIHLIHASHQGIYS